MATNQRMSTNKSVLTARPSAERSFNQVNFDRCFTNNKVTNELITEFAYFLVNDENSVVRQCAKELKSKDFEGCYKTQGKASQNVCTCKALNGEPCNSATIAQSSFGALVLSVMVAKMFY